MTDRVYLLKGYEDDFHAGQTRDGLQVLMGLLCPNLVAYFFSPEGVSLNREARPWHYPATQAGGIYGIYNQEFRCRLTRQFSDWKSQIGFEPGVIQIQRFFDEQQYVGVEDLPEHYESLDDFEDAQERQEAEQERREWLKNGQFVFSWAKDYYMAADGEVEST